MAIASDWSTATRESPKTMPEHALSPTARYGTVAARGNTERPFRRPSARTREGCRPVAPATPSVTSRHVPAHGLSVTGTLATKATPRRHQADENLQVGDDTARAIGRVRATSGFGVGGRGLTVAAR